MLKLLPRPVHISPECVVLMSEAQSSDAMNYLVIFMIKLAVTGLILVFAYYYFVDLPLRAAGHAPTNAIIF